MTVLLPNTLVTVKRRVTKTPATRDGLVDPWEDVPDEAEWTVIVSEAQVNLHSPVVDGLRRGGTRQRVEHAATFDVEDGRDVRAGDYVFDLDSDRVWHVDSAVSRIGAPGTTLDHVAVALVSVRGLVDGLV